MAGGVYDVRMARVNITMPDALHSRARAQGLNVSEVARRAVAAELDRLAKVAALDDYLNELDAELGPASDAERLEAQAWADHVFEGPGGHRRSA